jgi:hypothetical protein
MVVAAVMMAMALMILMLIMLMMMMRMAIQKAYRCTQKAPRVRRDMRGRAHRGGEGALHGGGEVALGGHPAREHPALLSVPRPPIAEELAKISDGERAVWFGISKPGCCSFRDGLGGLLGLFVLDRAVSGNQSQSHVCVKNYDCMKRCD